MELIAFSFGGEGFSDIVSDSYSFLNQVTEELEAKRSGGMRQIYNYVDLNYSDNITTTSDDHDYKVSNKISGDLTVQQLQQQREAELQKITGGKNQMKF